MDLPFFSAILAIGALIGAIRGVSEARRRGDEVFAAAFSSAVFYGLCALVGATVFKVLAYGV